MDYEKLAKFIIENVGGKDNIKKITHCATRLRFVLKNENLANTEMLIRMDGVLTVLSSGGQYQVVIGNTVTDVFDKVMYFMTCEEEINTDDIYDVDGNYGDDDYEEDDDETDSDELKNRHVKRIEKIEDVGLMPKIEKIFSNIFKKKK